MTTPTTTPATDPQAWFAEFTRQGQEAARAVTDAWSRTFTDVSLDVPFGSAHAAVDGAVDQVFDAALTLVDVQRALVKDVTAATLSLVENVAGQVTKAAAAA